MSWLDKLLPSRTQQTDSSRRKDIPEGLRVKCPACESVLYRTDVGANLYVRPKCDHHMRIGIRARLDTLLDAEGRYELGQEIAPIDALKLKDMKKYPDRIKAAVGDTGETDAMVATGGAIHALPVVVACFESEFMGSSMGPAVGECSMCGAQMALEQKVPFICMSATGGVRMQESLLSLMQMAKTTSVIQKLAEAKLPFISVLTDPTMGGMSASFTFMGDVMIAESKALIGLAGPRVIEQTVRERLPRGFQRAESLLQKGAIDMTVDRRNMRREIAESLALLQKQSADALA